MAGIKLAGWGVKCPSCGTLLQLYQYNSEKNPRIYYNCNNDIDDCNDRHLFSNKFRRPEDIENHAVQPFLMKETELTGANEHVEPIQDERTAGTTDTGTKAGRSRAFTF